MADLRAPEQGQTAYIVDEQGGTFAFPSPQDAANFHDSEQAGGAVELRRFTITVPHPGMTWDEVADYACSHGPERKGGAGPRPEDYANPTEPVSMWIKSGETTQRVTRVVQVSFATGRVLIVCEPDVVPRWVSLIKPRSVRP